MIQLVIEINQCRQYDLNHTFLFHCLARNSLLLLSKRFFNDSIEDTLGWHTLSWERRFYFTLF